MERLIISISGMRGIVGVNLTAAIAADYGRAFGSFLKNTISGKGKLTVCIGRDSRPSGQVLMSAVTAGLCSVGVDVIDLGIVTTPGVGVMVLEHHCAGGVIITASHNPSPYNGIKLLLGNAIAPPPDAASEIRRLFEQKNFALVASSSCGRVTHNEQTDALHIRKVLALVDPKAISAEHYRVVLDSVNGAGGRVTQKLLGELGCDVIAMNCEATGVFAHTPEPLAENLTGLCEAVKREQAQIGFAQDPDADRLAIVDQTGRYIGEEYTLALAAKYIFGRQGGRAATNLSTSRMIDDVAFLAGGQVIRTAVGEANVAAAMIEQDCVIGGEGNGGVIDLRVSPIRDSLVGIVLVLQLMTETARSVSRLVSEVGGYCMRKDKFKANEIQARQILDLAKEIFAGARVDTTDGCRFDFPDGWLHLRTSNTEPVMRLILEAKDEQTIKKYCDAVLEIRRKVVGG
jgi:phosphomannomutase